MKVFPFPNRNPSPVPSRYFKIAQQQGRAIPPSWNHKLHTLVSPWIADSSRRIASNEDGTVSAHGCTCKDTEGTWEKKQWKKLLKTADIWLIKIPTDCSKRNEAQKKGSLDDVADWLSILPSSCLHIGRLLWFWVRHCTPPKVWKRGSQLVVASNSLRKRSR